RTDLFFLIPTQYHSDSFKHKHQDSKGKNNA
ncbi:uncharacterized protein METZ01_LOCUS291855, partial [marine metagenome]